jgi:hypothetical protein
LKSVRAFAGCQFGVGNYHGIFCQLLLHLENVFGFKFKAVGISLKLSAVTPLRLTRGLPPGWQDIVLPKLEYCCSAFVRARQASIRFWKSPST